MDKNRLNYIIEKFNEEYKKHESDIKDAKNVSEMLHLYACYCGHLEALLMAIEIENR